MEEQLPPLTTAQAAAQLDCAESTVRRTCNDHDIGALITPRMRLLTTADIARLRVLIRSRPGNPGKSQPSQEG